MLNTRPVTSHTFVSTRLLTELLWCLSWFCLAFVGSGRRGLLLNSDPWRHLLHWICRIDRIDWIDWPSSFGSSVNWLWFSNDSVVISRFPLSQLLIWGFLSRVELIVPDFVMIYQWNDSKWLSQLSFFFYLSRSFVFVTVCYSRVTACRISVALSSPSLVLVLVLFLFCWVVIGDDPLDGAHHLGAFWDLNEVTCDPIGQLRCPCVLFHAKGSLLKNRHPAKRPPTARN